MACTTRSRLGLYVAACLVLLCPPWADARVFRVHYIFNGVISDYGWTYTHNQGRIAAHTRMAAAIASRGDTLETHIHESTVVATSTSYMQNLSRAGADLIVCSSFVFHEQAFQAAKDNPSTDFAHITGYYGGVPNFMTAAGRVYQARYVSGTVAGAETKAKRLGYIASIKIPEVYRTANAFYLGAQVGAGAIMNETYVEHKVDVLVVWIDTFFDPVKEKEAARRLHMLGCDIISYHTDTQAAPLYAKNVGLRSTGSNSNVRNAVGESVITSADFNWGPLYHDVMMASYDGSFGAPDTNRNLWYGYAKGVSVNHAPSFSVQPDTVRLFHDTVAQMTGGFDPFCHAAVYNGSVVNPGGACIGDFHLAVKMMYLIDPITDLGEMMLGSACGDGFYYTDTVVQSPPSYTVSCVTCPAGTFSVVPSAAEGVTACSRCRPGTYSVAGSTNCTECPENTSAADSGAGACVRCPSGNTNSGTGNEACLISDDSNDTVTIVVATVVGGVVLILIPVAGFVIWRDRRTINELHSEKAVAKMCACSIANMQLEQVDYIRTIKNPSPIITAFVQILDNLLEYRRYLPRQLLQRYHLDTDDIMPTRLPPGVEESPEVAVMFTDIQGSTALWELCPDAMNDALHTHNTLIRSCIAEHNGYEVKTIGDAFMVAFDTPTDAVLCALSIQKELVRPERWSDALKETKACHPTENGMWGGLRVRIGVHYGEVTHEENGLTGRMDYFGSVVNKAARLEAVGAGGAICASEEVIAVVNADPELRVKTEQHQVDGVTLKGFMGKTRVFLLLPISLKLRKEDVLRAVMDRKARFDGRHMSVTSLQTLGSKNEASLSGRRPTAAHPADAPPFATVKSSTVGKLQLAFAAGELQAPCDAFQRTLSHLVLYLERTKGTVVAACHTQLYMCWNSAPQSNVPQHTSQSVRYANLCQRYILQEGDYWDGTMALCAGPVVSGRFGTDSQKFLAVVGVAVDVCDELIRSTKHFKCFACVATLQDKLHILKDHTLKVTVRPIDRIGVGGASVLTVYELDPSRNIGQIHSIAACRDDGTTEFVDYGWGSEYTAAFDAGDTAVLNDHAARLPSDFTLPIVASEAEARGKQPRVVIPAFESRL